MSWLFGMNKGQDAQNPYLPPPPNSVTGGDDGGSKDDHDGSSKSTEGRDSKMEAYRFDSGALERAAKAAKDLEKSSEI